MRVIPATEMANWPFDDVRGLGASLALLVGDLPVWRLDGEEVSLVARLAYVDHIPREHFCMRREALATLLNFANSKAWSALRFNSAVMSST